MRAPPAHSIDNQLVNAAGAGSTPIGTGADHLRQANCSNHAVVSEAYGTLSSMSSLSQVLSFHRILKDSYAIRLLTAKNAPFVLATMSVHFSGSPTARPASELYELMAADLAVLRQHGMDLPKTPAEYCKDWVRSRWLVRKAGNQRTGELLEPSKDALSALHAIQSWEKPRSAVTASRLESISEALSSLARDTDPNISSRLERLQLERERLDHEIERVSQGDFELPSPELVSEKIGDILTSASSVPADFARVRHEFEVLNRTLRRQLLDPDSTRGEVLDDIFAGVDVISSSEAGRSFNGFYSIITDPERSAYIDNWIDQILSSEPARRLDQETRISVRRLTRDMEEAGAEVNSVMTGLARSLRHYVASEQFAEDRRMIELIRETRALAADAVEASELSAIHAMETPLQRIGMSIQSVSSIVLSNPGEEIVEGETAVNAPQALDVEELLSTVRQSEIDLEELINSVQDTVTSEAGQATISQVLARHPATQGLASIVGLLHLGLKYGIPSGCVGEVCWKEGESTRRGTIDQYSFDTTSLEEM